MKRYWIGILVLCLWFTLAACGGETLDIYEDDGALTLEDVAGWWTKPEGYEGITALHTFCIDADAATATEYDSYGNAHTAYPCWCDGDYVSIDVGDPFGTASYLLVGDQLLDEEGSVHYVRRDPIPSGSAPYTVSDLVGTWYKNGQIGDSYEMLVITEDGYKIEQMGYTKESGTITLSERTLIRDDSSYTGPLLECTPADGLFSTEVWIMDEGNILFDDAHDAYYIRSSVAEDDAASLKEKYAVITETWSASGQKCLLTFYFSGEVVLYTEDSNGNSTHSTIGTWIYKDGTLHMTYSDGTSQEISVQDTIHVHVCDMSFTRWSAQ